MNNLIFETGEVELAINGDESRIIRFNPKDMNFVERFEKAAKSAEKLFSKYKELEKSAKVVDNKNKNQEMTIKIVKESRQDAMKLVNDLFDDDVAAVIFGKIHPMSVTSNGKSILQNFLEAVSEYIYSETKQALENDKELIESYKNEYDRFTS